MAHPSHYKDFRNVIAVNREYVALKEKVARLTAEWEDLIGEAERIDAEYHRKREELAGQQSRADSRLTAVRNPP
jgi:predicted nuclease with TOPRIM domain